MKFKSLLLLPLLLILTACEPPEQIARDTSAALGGAIVSAQAQYLASCTANKTQNVCVAINDAIVANNALDVADEAYCGWSSNTPATSTAVCIETKSAQAGLQAAISNANTFITTLKGFQK